MDCRGKNTRKDSLEPATTEPEREESETLLEFGTPENANRQRNRKETEDYLLQTVKNGEFGEIEKEITPMALKCCKSNALLMGMKINFELRKMADSKGPDEERFNQLATSVEQYTSCLLDPLRADKHRREELGDALDAILDKAIELEQKQFFAHPVIYSEMKRKWYGRDFITSGLNKWRRLISIWCVFDLVFSPILYALFSLIRIHRGNKQKRRQVTQIYPVCMETPYFKFVRDTVSYIVLLVLHYALCLQPSTVAFTGLEVTILIFFIGRCLVEGQQICDVMQHLKRQRGDGAQSNITVARKTLWMYQRDLWNRLDIISLLLYLVILTLRIASFITSGSVENNRVLAIAGYFYSFNTLVLTFRVFGHVMEQSKHVGTIQIALFSILKDVGTIFWQFTAAIFAFSIAITKVYMAEKSFVANGRHRNDTLCEASGISCWWMMITHMGWSLLGRSEDVDAMKSVDFPSETLARILYAGFLIMGVILLVNMLIALLSNTYQRIQDNSLKEWSFKRAVTIQTYDGYDPIPVPFNIIYSVFKLVTLVKGKDENKGMDIMLDAVVVELDREYSAKRGNHFPVTGEAKDDLVVRETGRNRQMVSQILSSTFQSKGGGIKCSGPEKVWEVDTGIRVEGPLLTCAESIEDWPGARYCKAVTVDSPYFEVVILETGKQMSLGVGIVQLNESTDDREVPECGNGFVGYFTDGFIFDDENGESGRETKGPVISLRGDRIRCTVMFENKQERDGKVPVLFTVNGRKIMIHSSDGENPGIFIDSGKMPYPYIVMNDGCSVLVKMCSRDNENYEASSIADLRKQVEEMKTSLEEANRNLQTLLARMPNLSTN